MLNHLKINTLARLFKGFHPLLLAATGLSAALLLIGCKSSDAKGFNEATLQAAQAGAGHADADQASPKLVLREGDTIRLTFPGAPNLNALQAIRRDGKLALQLVGEVQAAGLTPSELEKKLLELYGPQLQSKELTVTLESSAFTVYVTGSVLKPGKVTADHPLTVMEAIMEANGFDFKKANLKNVRVIRSESGKTEYFTLNLKAYMDGKNTETFKLRPSDIIYVPERFAWF
jgi:polysaccharide biosynthesis/export protein